MFRGAGTIAANEAIGPDPFASCPTKLDERGRGNGRCHDFLPKSRRVAGQWSKSGQLFLRLLKKIFIICVQAELVRRTGLRLDLLQMVSYA